MKNLIIVSIIISISISITNSLILHPNTIHTYLQLFPLVSLDPQTIVQQLNPLLLDSVSTITNEVPKLADASQEVLKNLQDVDVGNEIIKGFNGILDSNPDLKLSTSEFTNKNIIPKIGEASDQVVKFWSYSTGPLAKNIEDFKSTIPTNPDVIINQKVNEIGDGVGYVVNRVGERVSGGINDAVTAATSTASSLATSIDVDSLTKAVTSIDVKVPDVTSIPIPAVDVDGIVNSITAQVPKVDVDVDATVNTVNSALSRAGEKFSSQLSAKGNELTNNLATAGSSLSSVFGKIGDDIVTKGIPKTTEIFEKLPDALDKTVPTVTKSVDELGSAAINNFQKLGSGLEKTIVKPTSDLAVGTATFINDATEYTKAGIESNTPKVQTLANNLSTYTVKGVSDFSKNLETNLNDIQNTAKNIKIPAIEPDAQAKGYINSLQKTLSEMTTELSTYSSTLLKEGDI